jgi:ssDNA-binding Zn-finger/Zn-ribbon topoisomerase 1
MDNVKTDIEGQERRLVEYLIEEVVSGISGRNQEEVFDVSPSRVLFAGVLQTPRQSDAMPFGGKGIVAPADTALGLDFKIVPTTGSTVRLKITPSWSVYYPVFPTHEQAILANSGLTIIPMKSDQNEPPAIQDDIPEVGLETTEPDDDSKLDADETEEVQASSKPGKPGSVILPRVFRRYDVKVETIVIELPANADVKTIGQNEVMTALDKARAVILADPRIWKHLSEPSDARRQLGDAQILSNNDSYQRALTENGKAVVDLPPWSASIRVDITPELNEQHTLRVRVLLSNTTSSDISQDADRLLEERSLIDAQMTVEIDNGNLQPFDFLLAPKDYRSKPQMPARGINCTAKCAPEYTRQIKTETMPLFKQPYYRTKDQVEVPFTSLDIDDPTLELEKTAAEMDEYLKLWDKFLLAGKPSTWGQPEIEACSRDRDEFHEEIEGFRLGIETLRRDAKLAEAFRLMNRVFAQIGLRSGGKLKAWRLFQIGFIVSQLPCLAVRELDGSATDEYAKSLRRLLDEVGVLWFPTGGGKTESYLGLIAVALIYDRLRGKTSGVCAWMRFPLRMLSLQQLERLAKVIAALNELRSKNPHIASGDPFAIGYYVGDAVTPNSVSKDKMKALETDKDARDNLRLLRKCPFCGSAVDIKALRKTWRVAHVCSNAGCFSNTSESLGDYKGSLPLCIVDNEIYRYLPSVLVGTVDKLAIIASSTNSRYFAHIVRGTSQKCPVHGYTSYNECIERGNWAAECPKTKRDLTNVPVFKDPGPALLIQDELHLLRAELGVFNGHYEGLLRHLGEKAYMRPKILAATATIEAYDTHTFHVYLAKSCRYPQPAWEAGESFYATSKPLKHRRFYLGILNHTKGIEDSAIRAMGLYMRAIRRLKINPQIAAEIMGVPEAKEDEIQATLRLFDLSLCYVNRKATGGSLSDKMSFIERFLGRENLGTVNHRVLTGDNPPDSIGETLDTIERQKAETGEKRLDVVIATSLISHGVDLERINMMTVCGMPSHYAEYVQSTSRAARSHPGAVFVCFKSRDPREHSQFEFFTEMHEHMERLIEAVAVNRFASFAPQKTVPGLLAGLLLCDYTPRLFGKDINRPLDHIPTLKIALGFTPGTTSTRGGCVNREELQKTIEKIIGVDKVHPPASQAQVKNVQRRIAEAFDDQLGRIGRSNETKLKEVIKPITSFRDVDEGVEFGSKDASPVVDRLRAK